jgi:DNA polymerase III subunit alpha
VVPHGPEGSGGLAVRYGLAALKGVGERAMADVVTSRGAGFASLAEFARRVDPRLLNKRQLESLIAAGCFDAIEPSRAGVYLLAEALLGTANAAAAARESAQAALFGEATGVEDRGLAMLVPPGLAWSLAETMAKEKDAYGFYFSGHPAEAWRAVLDAEGAKTFAEAMASSPPTAFDRNGNARTGVVMAGLIEEARWRQPQNGRSRYLTLKLSDRSGQFEASCFDEATQARLERFAGESPAVLLQAELNWRQGEDAPRVRVNGATPLAELAARSRGRLVVTLADAGEVTLLAEAVAGAAGKGRGELIVLVPAAGGLARVALGRHWLLDAEVQARLARALGAERIVAEAYAGPRLVMAG